MKKQDFFEYFKEYLLKEHNDELHKFIHHYETMLQQKERLQALLNDYEEWDFDIHYEQSKDKKFGGNDKFIIYLYKEYKSEHDYSAEYADYHYEIELEWEDRMWGYCTCEPDDVGYVEEKKCCGISCDWYAPAITIRKIVGLGYIKFDGKERDLWELEKKWDTYLKEHKEKQKQERIKYIDEQIARLEEEKQRLLSE
jgi:hypothetical protein